MALSALNDLAKIQLDKDEYGLGSDDKGTAENGVLIELPDQFNYYGMWSFAFEKSFMDREKLDELYKYWESKKGQRVYWTALSEKGNIIATDDGGRFAFVKLTSLIAVDDADSKAHNIHSNGAGSFAV